MSKEESLLDTFLIGLWKARESYIEYHPGYYPIPRSSGNVCSTNFQSATATTATAAQRLAEGAKAQPPRYNTCCMRDGQKTMTTMTTALFLLLFTRFLAITTQALHLDLPKGLCVQEVEALSRQKEEPFSVDDHSSDMMRLAVCLHLNELVG